MHQESRVSLSDRAGAAPRVVRPLQIRATTATNATLFASRRQIRTGQLFRVPIQLGVLSVRPSGSPTSDHIHNNNERSAQRV